MKVTVTNTGRHPTERAGRVFPARATVEHDVDPDRVDQVRAHPDLTVLEAGDDIDGATVEELRELARDRSLAVSGTKAELVDRIRGHDDAGEA